MSILQTMPYIKATEEEKKDFMDISEIECKRMVERIEYLKKKGGHSAISYSTHFDVVVDDINCIFNVNMCTHYYSYELKMFRVTSWANCDQVFFKECFHRKGEEGIDVNYDPDSYAEVMAIGFKLLKELKFYKSEGQFLTKDDLKFTMAYKKAFGKHIKNKKEQCPVCMDVKTALRTPCNHPLCVQCWDKLPKLKCPTCRKGLYPECESDHSDDED
jgi:hypothetical protein